MNDGVTDDMMEEAAVHSERISCSWAIQSLGQLLELKSVRERFCRLLSDNVDPVKAAKVIAADLRELKGVES